HPDMVRSGSCLIRPTAKWLRVAGAWSGVSETLTGITKLLLEREGVPPTEAINRLLTATNGRDLFSNDPSFDQYWLEKLAEAADVDLNPRRLGDAKALFSKVANENPGLTNVLPEAEALAAESVSRQHRAEQDARRLAIVYSVMLRKSSGK